MTAEAPNILERIRDRADALQRKHSVLGFPYAVVKKYGEDESGRHAALLTYYGFLSVFPLLLLVVSILSRLLVADEALRLRLVEAIVPDQLQATVDSALAGLPTTGVPLVIGVVGLTLSGLGIVRAAYDTLNHLAGVPYRDRFDWLPRTLRTVAALVLLVIGALATSALTVAASTLADLGPAVRIPVLVAIAGAVALVLWGLVALLLPRRIRLRAVWPALVSGSIAVAVLLMFGAALLPMFVTRSGPVYGSFATIVGMFALLSLVCQALVMSAEVALVRRRHLWPRALDSAHPTDADRRALTSLVATQQRLRAQSFSTTFD